MNVQVNVRELLKNISERIQSSASVKAVYGDPIVAEGKTIIPVARVRYGFGGGGGSQGGEPTTEEGQAHPQTGGGGGGGVDVTPVGFIEVTPDETRYPTFPIWLNIPLSKSSAFFKPLSICETLAVGMAIITP